MAVPRCEETQDVPAGILLVAFGVGTSRGAPALREFESRVRAAFPDLPLRWAFTARHESRRPVLAEGKGPGPSVAEALFRFADEGVLRVAAQPLHLVPGSEHAALLREAALATDACPRLRVSVGRSLLEDEESLRRMARALRSFSPPSAADEVFIWVGHGSKHAAQNLYRGLADMLREEDPPLFLGTLNGDAGVDALLPELLSRGVSRACLIPFFALPGRHAARDLAGQGAASWRIKLEKAGIRCRTRTPGMVEHDIFAGMWVDRLRQALAELPRGA